MVCTPSHPPGYTYQPTVPAVLHAADMPQDALTALTYHLAELTFPDGQLTVVPDFPS